MFSSISKIVALAILVVAAGASPAANGHEGPTTTVTVTAQPTSTSVSQCNNGGTQPQCCNKVESSNSTDASALLESLNIVLDGVVENVGINCVDIAGDSCSGTAKPVCCSNDNFSGVIVIGCNPINIAT